MAAKWIKSKFPGVRYRVHPTRKHGVGPDKYITIYYRLKGETTPKQESLGWASQGWTEKKASIILSELRHNQATGNGPRTLAEKREIEEARRKAEQDRMADEARDAYTFDQTWKKYFPYAQSSKTAQSWKREDQLYRLWIGPVIADLPLKEIAPFHLEKVKSVMGKAGKAPRTIHYALAVIRQVFNYARTNGLFVGENPVSLVKKPTVDNRRFRFLSREEADRLLKAIHEISPNIYNIVLLALDTGMRAGEIFSLTWADIDLDRGMLTLRNTKSGKTRTAFLTDRAKAVLDSIPKGKPSELIFPARGARRSRLHGGKIQQISDTFNKCVDNLGLNDDIEDRRLRVTFHTLRHTYASWLVEAGVDLYTVKELLGHSDFKMTSRYSHLGENTLQSAVRRLEKQNGTANPDKVISIHNAAQA
jgi:integrase